LQFPELVPSYLVDVPIHHSYLALSAMWILDFHPYALRHHDGSYDVVILVRLLAFDGGWHLDGNFVTSPEVLDVLVTVCVLKIQYHEQYSMEQMQLVQLPQSSFVDFGLVRIHQLQLMDIHFSTILS